MGELHGSCYAGVATRPRKGGVKVGSASGAEHALRAIAAGDPIPKYYFNADTNEELASAFGIIRDSLARNMYLSK